MSPGRYRQGSSWLDEFKQSLNKFEGSFEITVPVGGRLLQAQIRPQGDGIYTVGLNGTFLAHLVKKEEEEWTDYFGEKEEIYQVIGKLIDEKNNGGTNK